MAPNGPGILCVAGIRSQYVKLASLQRASCEMEWMFVDTGQHYSRCLGDQYHDEYEIWFDHRLRCGGPEYSSGAVLGRMIGSLEELVEDARPTAMVTFGDANTTLATALVARRLGIPLAHVEAGVRTGSSSMEEFNRVTADRVAALHLASCKTDLVNLVGEGLAGSSCFVGDLVRDLCVALPEVANDSAPFALMTLHREEHVRDGRVLERLAQAIDSVCGRGVFLAHPRVVRELSEWQVLGDQWEVRESVPHRDLLRLVNSCSYLVTDSGALQRESYYLGRRAVVVQEYPFWRSLVDSGYHIQVDPWGEVGEVLGALVETCRPAPLGLFDDFGVPPIAPRVVGAIENWAERL